MKQAFYILLLVLTSKYSISQPSRSSNNNKLVVYLSDSSVYMTSNIRKDHDFFGYQSPSLKSKRLIRFSVFTNKVEGNPCLCEFGSFYETSGMGDMTLKYEGKSNDFIKVALVKQNELVRHIYFQKRNIAFEK